MSIYKESQAQIEPAIQSILSQTFQDFEMVIVLDCPENKNAETYLNDLSCNHKNITIIKNEKNIGLGASLNKAIEVANGEYIARMDTEDTSHYQRFEKQVAYLDSNPDTHLLFTQWQEEFTDGSTQVRAPKSTDVQNITKYFFIKSILLHPTLMARAQVLKDNPYPEISRPEDFVLFLELMKKNYSFRLIEEVLYTYKIDTTEKYEKVRTYSKNLLPYLFKNVPYFWHNILFWFYFLRIFIEFCISRNKFVFGHLHKIAAKIWKMLFK